MSRSHDAVLWLQLCCRTASVELVFKVGNCREPSTGSDMSQDKVYSLDDLKSHTTDKSCWLAVNGNVHDVTEFLEEHPGGYDIILTSTGKDATKDFNEIGHSKQAKQLLEKYVIGKLEGATPVLTSAVESEKETAARSTNTKPLSLGSRMFNVVLPLVLLAIAVALNVYLTKKQQQ